MRHLVKDSDGNLEDAIVRELSTRTPSTRTDQLKIDYCLLTHANESAITGGATVFTNPQDED